MRLKTILTKIDKMPSFGPLLAEIDSEALDWINAYPFDTVKKGKFPSFPPASMSLSWCGRHDNCLLA